MYILGKVLSNCCLKYLVNIETKVSHRTGNLARLAVRQPLLK